ncbi:putative regulatory factor sgt1 protein [Phaeoacremonium minimum UCRPA7]|uniref:Putative regulatory factor sgt1 protein n=1 Tax=Phaeoacremonium minimum (strain UCR-PA7) TaxID=1286976 RepID=R8BT44_PHAM7|nr:putative regulatory factor sgt1 protein [Phaeoacremonium minimum UCRPA7]EOO02573.1 putative regulatory factor sgt1 protein [Phaeoacremonium minimum UCRPA7]
MLFIIDSQLDPRKSLSALETVRKTAFQLSDQLTKEYIWHRDAFNLESKSQEGLLYLHGITDYGDSVEDEWLIVYILRELTKQFSNLWVRVFDSDGEFLLIEAANVLPKWLSPESDANRVWIQGGQLRLLPAATDSGPAMRNLRLLDAVQFIKSTPELMVHSAFVEAEAFYRLDKYPDQIQKMIHCARVKIPRKLAYILHRRPKAIAPAVEAFYLRDPLTLKPLMSKAVEKLVFPPLDFVTVSVRFTRVLYAQLKSQRFEPPPPWQNIMRSSDRNSPSGDSDDKDFSMLDLGMKVACGFEMLAASASKSKSRVAVEVAMLLEDLEEDGDQALPSDVEIKSWDDVERDDDDSWMDVNYDDFEQELDGKKNQSGKSAFGDSTAQADLRKIVSRFEAFLNDDQAGLDGAELDEMDEDDDDDEDYDDSESEDREVSFDEQEFARMMKEMMGFPSTETDANKSRTMKGKGKEVSFDSRKDAAQDEEDDEIQKLAELMEKELNEHGALNLDPTPTKLRALRDKASEVSTGEPSTKAIAPTQLDEEQDSDAEEVDVDYNLAKNLLESFKSQAGVAGPAGNILGMMGLRLPRDEDDDREDDGKK